jgi:hypothetical protein
MFEENAANQNVGWAGIFEQGTIPLFSQLKVYKTPNRMLGSKPMALSLSSRKGRQQEFRVTPTPPSSARFENFAS